MSATLDKAVEMCNALTREPSSEKPVKTVKPLLPEEVVEGIQLARLRATKAKKASAKAGRV